MPRYLKETDVGKQKYTELAALKYSIRIIKKKNKA